MGVVTDSRLTLSDHVASVCRSGYYQLRQLCPAVRCTSDDATKMLVQTFIVSCLNYCYALFYGITDKLIHHLLSFQNAAARLVMGTRRSDIFRLCYVRHVQGYDACLPVPVRPCSRLPGQRLSTDHRHNVSDNCVLLTLECSLSNGRTAVSETGPLQLLEPECGTVCRQT